MRALTGLARCVPQLADGPLPDNGEKKRDREKKRTAGSRATALATLIRDEASCRPFCSNSEENKMRPLHAPLSSHGRPIGPSLEQALTGGCWHSGRLRPAGRFTCRVYGQIIRARSFLKARPRVAKRSARSQTCELKPRPLRIESASLDALGYSTSSGASRRQGR